MVLDAVSSDGCVFQRDLRLNTAAYTTLLEIVVKPWIDLVRNGRLYVFQQDSVPAYKAVMNQDWVMVNLHDHTSSNISQPNLPDLNHPDYYTWTVLEWVTDQRTHNTTDSLKAAITRVMSNINTVHLILVCQGFRSHIEAIVAAEGGYIE